MDCDAQKKVKEKSITWKKGRKEAEWFDGNALFPEKKSSKKILNESPVDSEKLDAHFSKKGVKKFPTTFI